MPAHAGQADGDAGGIEVAQVVTVYRPAAGEQGEGSGRLGAVDGGDIAQGPLDSGGGSVEALAAMVQARIRWRSILLVMRTACSRLASRRHYEDAQSPGWSGIASQVRRRSQHDGERAAAHAVSSRSYSMVKTAPCRHAGGGRYRRVLGGRRWRSRGRSSRTAPPPGCRRPRRAG